ncbi:MAG: DHA1 family bicyclomycin/chloramphenicol resistance-like MFS transporter [Halocynthiibacter sp.]|jgi:DHA1 family bicyclomycin/chloramphenicol resistance-like MFS transporter
MSDENHARFLDRTTPPNIATLVLLAGIGALSMNVFLPALPEMTTHFNTTYGVMQLSVALYLAANGLLQIFVGPLADKYGRRPVSMAGVIIFILASVACIYAPNVTIFLIFRMIQSVIAVGFVLSRAVVRDMYPPNRAAAMIGYVAMGMSLVPMFSPVIGGVLTEHLGWTSSFWLMAIAGVFTLALVWFDQGETNVSQGLSLSQQFAQYPELFKSQRFWGYALATAFSSGAFFAYLGGAPFVGTQIFGLSPSDLGFWFGAPAVGYLLGNFTTGLLATRVGLNRMIIIGASVASSGIALSMLLFLFDMGSVPSFFGFMTFVGFGNGMVIPNATSGALSVRPHLAGTASGLSGALMVGGGAALAALAGALLTPERGVYPLLIIMLSSCLLGVTSIIMVIRRERRIGLI